MAKIDVLNKEIRFYSVDEEDFISLTDIAKHKNVDAPADIVKNWLCNKNTIEWLGLWDKLHNPNFNRVEFDPVKNKAGSLLNGVRRTRTKPGKAQSDCHSANDPIDKR